MGFAIRDGIILGLSLATLFGFGPALLALLQTSIQRGFKSGVFFAFGVFLSDLVLVYLAFEGSIQIVNEPENKLNFAIVSSVMLAVFGMVTYFKKPKIDNKGVFINKNAPPLTYTFKGFILNIANPFVWIFWIGTMIAITANYGKTESSAILVLFISALITVFCADTLKAYLSGRLKPYVTYTVMRRINQISGIGLVLFGISLVIRALYF